MNSHCIVLIYTEMSRIDICKISKNTIYSEGIKVIKTIMAETPRGPDTPSSGDKKAASLIKKIGQVATGALLAAQLAGAETGDSTTPKGPNAKQDVPGLAVPDTPEGREQADNIHKETGARIRNLQLDIQAEQKDSKL